MAKTLLRALIVGAFALTVWQAAENIAVSKVQAVDLYDCGDFSSQQAAQDHYNQDTSDPDGLDADHDGLACEDYNYGGTTDLYDCGDFPSQQAAQNHYNQDTSDPDGLDADNDGQACEDYNYGGNTDGGSGDSGGGGGGLSGSCHESCIPDNYYNCGNPYYNGAPYSGAPYYYGPPGNPYYNGAPANPYSGAPGNPYYNPYAYPYNTGYPYNGTPNYYNQCADGLNHSPGFNRPAAMTFLAEKTTISCGAETNLVVRVVYPDGVGAPNRLVTFQSSLGTVYSNLLTDYSGYVQTKFVAQLSPAIVQIDAMADGLRQSVQVKVDCPQPPLNPPLGVTYVSPVQTVISPPSTGDAGLLESANSSAPWAMIAAVLLILSAPVATCALVRLRK